MSNSKAETESLAIQNTLSMTIEERLELLANLIVDRITEDLQNDEHLYKKILRAQNA